MYSSYAASKLNIAVGFSHFSDIVIGTGNTVYAHPDTANTITFSNDAFDDKNAGTISTDVALILEACTLKTSSFTSTMSVNEYIEVKNMANPSIASSSAFIISSTIANLL